MYATVFEGSEEDGVPFDSEAYDVWARFLPADHIIRGNKHDNFWEMGETGPCGPCSEIHFDLRDEAEIAARPGREMVNTGHPQVIEIWNLVFMQFNRKANGTLEPLPAKNVDTGMGFERLCMIMQGKKSNYDTDVFQPTIGRLAALSGKSYGADAKCDVAMRVVADHLRAIAFSIACIFLSNPSFVSPAPRPVISAGSSPRSTEATALLVVVFPIPISPVASIS